MICILADGFQDVNALLIAFYGDCIKMILSQPLTAKSQLMLYYTQF
jgi:hypothetical protein